MHPAIPAKDEQTVYGRSRESNIVVVLTAAIDDREQPERAQAVRRIQLGHFYQRSPAFLDPAQPGQHIAVCDEGEQDHARFGVQRGKGSVPRPHVSPVGGKLVPAQNLGEAGLRVWQGFLQAVAVEVEFISRDLDSEMAGGKVEGFVDMALGDGFVLPGQADRVQGAFRGRGQVSTIVAPIEPGIVMHVGSLRKGGHGSAGNRREEGGIAGHASQTALAPGRPARVRADWN